MVKFDSALPGTAQTEWSASERFDGLPALDLGSMGRLTIVAAHPDDETLGAGGLIAMAARSGIPVRVVVVTDGSASNPRSAIPAADVATLRSGEVGAALAALTPSAELVELGFPDGRIKRQRAKISAALEELLPVGGVICAPWRGDGHRDHRIVGEICAELAVANGSTLLEYPIWMWHWSHPDDADLPWSSAELLELTPGAQDAKRLAISLHRSQVAGFGEADGDAPVLRPDFLENFETGRETFFVSHSEQTKPEAYFDGLYERNDDPWRLASRWYERRKRAISTASLPRRHFESALEIGCSVGELTAAIAERAGSLLAIDISQAAVEQTARRVSDLPTVTVEHRDATWEFPDGPFDLIVLSEVAYYWDTPTLRAMIEQIVAHLSTDGILLACHWRHRVSDYPLGGDQVHDLIRETAALHRIVLHEEEDFVLEIFGLTADSVARQEGLLD